MNGIGKFLVDTNVFVHLLNGNTKAQDILFGGVLSLSFITEIALQSKKNLSEDSRIEIKNLLTDCFIIDINSEIKSTVIDIRLNSKLKLPDAIIAASAIWLYIPLLTADSDFTSLKGLNVILFNV